MSSQISLVSQVQAMYEALLTPIQKMQLTMNATITNALAVNSSAIQALTKNIQNNLITLSSHFSTYFSSILENISFHENYIEVPESLYAFTIHENEYQQEVPLTDIFQSPKKHITLISALRFLSIPG